MKSMIEEYGKLIICILAVLGLIAFALSNETVKVTDPVTGVVVEKPVGFLAHLKHKSAIKPMDATENSSVMLKEMSENKAFIKDKFKVDPEKLYLEEEFNLLDYIVYSLDMNGVPLTVSVTSFVFDDGREVPIKVEDGKYIVSLVNKEGEEPLKPGRYIAKYHVLEEKTKLELEFNYAFCVDNPRI